MHVGKYDARNAAKHKIYLKEVWSVPTDSLLNFMQPYSEDL